MGISPKRKDKLTVVLNNEGVKSFIVISVALEMALNAIVSVLCCEIDENCRGDRLFVMDVVAALLLPKNGFQLNIHACGFRLFSCIKMNKNLIYQRKKQQLYQCYTYRQSSERKH